MAAVVNMCLAVNGGSLGSGAVAADRDDDFVTSSHSLSGQSGSFSAEITFPSSTISYIKYRLRASCYQYDGSATASLEILLNVSETWTSVWSWSGSGWQSVDRDVRDTSEDNGGNGWKNVTGIKVTGSISGTDTGSASAYAHEMQAWGEIHLDYAGIV